MREVIEDQLKAERRGRLKFEVQVNTGMKMLLKHKS